MVVGRVEERTMGNYRVDYFKRGGVEGSSLGPRREEVLRKDPGDQSGRTVRMNCRE